MSLLAFIQDSSDDDLSFSFTILKEVIFAYFIKKKPDYRISILTCFL